MISFLKYFKGIAYFLVMIILFQSCVVYNKSSVTKAAEYNNRLIKIKTIDNDKYKLKWIEKEGENVVSIKNTKRKYFNIKDINQIVLHDPEPHVVSLEKAVNHHGMIHLMTRDKKGRYSSHDFIKISEYDGIITGYKMIGIDKIIVSGNN